MVEARRSNSGSGQAPDRVVASQHRDQHAEQGDRDHRRHEARRQEPIHRIRNAERGEQATARAPATVQMLAQVGQFGRRRVGSRSERGRAPTSAARGQVAEGDVRRAGRFEPMADGYGKHVADDTRCLSPRLCGGPPRTRSRGVAASPSGSPDVRYRTERRAGDAYGRSTLLIPRPSCKFC